MAWQRHSKCWELGVFTTQRQTLPDQAVLMTVTIAGETSNAATIEESPTQSTDHDNAKH